MSEIGYVLRKRYIRGEHEGKSYIFIRSGFVISLNSALKNKEHK